MMTILNTKRSQRINGCLFTKLSMVIIKLQIIVWCFIFFNEIEALTHSFHKVRHPSGIAAESTNFVMKMKTPENMQSVSNFNPRRRFMWTGIGDTFSGMLDGMTKSAQRIGNIFTGTNTEETRPKRYLVKNPPGQPQIIKVVHNPRKIMKILSNANIVYGQRPIHKEIDNSDKIKYVSTGFKYLNNHELRKLEKEQETKIESVTNGWIPNVIHHHVTKSNEIITQKPLIRPLFEPSASHHKLTIRKPYTKKPKNTYEVTEINNDDIPHKFVETNLVKHRRKPKLTTTITTLTTELPNYPEHFLKHLRNENSTNSKATSYASVTFGTSNNIGGGTKNEYATIQQQKKGRTDNPISKISWSWSTGNKTQRFDENVPKRGSLKLDNTV